jgi:hypothetical protein
LLNRGPCVISAQELGNVYSKAVGGSSSSIENKPSIDQSKLNSIPLNNPIGTGELAEVFSGQISIISINSIEIEHVNYLPVYDLTTTSTIYFANGILSSNCRCVAIPYIEEIVSNIKSRRAA